jgi:hypothetical protein
MFDLHLLPLLFQVSKFIFKLIVNEIINLHFQIQKITFQCLCFHIDYYLNNSEIYFKFNNDFNEIKKTNFNSFIECVLS